MMMSGNEWGHILRDTAVSAAAATAPPPYDNSHDTPSKFNNKNTVEALLITFGVISWICVLLRIHTRRRLDALGWDDLFVVLFRITGTLGSIFILLLFDNGLGKHFKDIGLANRMTFQKKYYVALLSYTLSTGLMKLCLLTQYLRLFVDDLRARRVCWFFIIVSSLWGLAFAVIAIVPCVPVSGFWDWGSGSAGAHCYGFGSKVPGEIAGTYAAHVTTNVALDLIILAIPIPLYFKTFKQRKQRVGFSCMILLGILINLVSIWRLHTIITTQAATYPVSDPTFYGPQSIVLASLEIDLASIVASIPVFWPMLTQTWGKIFVTQEVHVTRHHRRLSGDAGDDDNFELRATPSLTSFTRSRAGSDGSLKLVIQDTDGRNRGGFLLTHDNNRSNSNQQQQQQRSESRSGRSPEMGAGLAGAGGGSDKKLYDLGDRYVRERIYPLDGGPMVTSEAQVVSEGQRGFERNYREHFAGVTAADPKNNSNNNSSSNMSVAGTGIIRPGMLQTASSLDKLDSSEPAARISSSNNEERSRRSRDGGHRNQRDRSWSLSMSRKSSAQRFLT